MRKEPSTERLIAEDQYSNMEAYLLYLIHIATYKYCIPFVASKKVLDYGCGSGYGTALIGDHSMQAIGVDISSEAIDYAQSHFSAPNLRYLQIQPAEVAPLPFPDSSFDVVLSFQVIEHVRNVPAYLQEIHRVLSQDGQVIIATPDRSSRLFSFQKPWNIWHLREYSRDQLRETLLTYFSDVNVLQTGGQPEFLQVELRRTDRLRWVTLPFTLPFIPDTIRIACLRILKDLRYNVSSKSRIPMRPDFDDTVISISPEEEFSVDLVAIAKKKSVV